MTKDGAGDRTAAAARDAMMHEIARDVRLVADRLGKDEFDPAVMAALGRVPREAFVPEGRRAAAYVNAPLPIGHGQTISQPFIVAAMTDMLALRAESRVLEIGTGCGYQTAVLAEIAARVYTIEFVAELGESAARRLESLGYTNIAYRTGDGRAGWPEHAPYDAVIVTAAAETPPPALVEQLAPGRRMAIPLGPRREGQELCLLIKGADGQVARRAILPVAFVPLVSGPRCQD
ncbi:MAG: protein-L-isoaspartate(D-aspartate) O-methyltransferase [Proteobacteria bacterium]|nr:protein-L-isoaspartate(D-aspartate) O-methyltransferase [Pseudomonadota bacterium]